MGKTEPQRKCIGCDEMIEKKGLLRIVKDKEGNISLDPTGKKNGRGAYICRDIKCFEAARKKKAFERSFKCKIPDEIYDSLKTQIENNHEEMP
ncbi:MAG: YlxR family protein [Ruminiclostridium sp.]|nr:YlxR family protein [Ruminiclostridium sp.]